jgi:hypothetical protein
MTKFFKLLLAPIIVLGSAFTSKVLTKVGITTVVVLSTNEYKSQFLTQAQADLLYKPITYVPNITDPGGGYSITIDGTTSYALPPVDYNRDVQSKPNFGVVAFSSEYYDLIHIPTIPVLAYGLYNNSNEYSVDTTALHGIMSKDRANSAIAAMTSSINTKISTVTSSMITTALGGSPIISETQSLSLSSNSLSIKSGTTIINTISLPIDKRRETYSGSSNGSGVYTVTFGTSYSVTPNIQANWIGAADNQNLRVTAISTTGFSVLARNRVDVVGLLPTWTNVSGASIDVLITEK